MNHAGKSPPEPRPMDALDLTPLLTPLIAKHRIPGIAAARLQGDRITAAGVAGVRKVGAAEPITLTDQFHLGSNTKAMTATLVGMLVDEGRLTWNASLAEIFGGPKTKIAPAWWTVRLEHVLAHRAGLAENVGPFATARRAFGGGQMTTQRRLLVESTLARPPTYTPGNQRIYSNVGYIVAGAAAEKATGQSWEALMQEKLFTPLGLRSAGFGAPGTAGEVDEPWGHHTATRARDPGSWRADNARFLGPAGTVHLAITDWAAFIALHLQGDPANPNRRVRLLKPESLARLHTPFPADHGRYFGGWVIETRQWAQGDRTGDAGRVLWHNGSNGRWFSVAWLAPERDFAVLVACNRGDGGMDKALDEVVQTILQQRHLPLRE
ncbi:MAG TPA: serine hydrolase domain-containing protein [Lacipirellulaceae bacterium]|nr:serine hydrolase domain-containing protein [Lacipirellulaceae bacterium]